MATVNNWLNVLSASYIIHLLPPYYENIGKRLIKTPKIYFHDTGLAAYLLGITNETQLDSHPLRGQLFENYVVSNVLKEFANKNIAPAIYFYRDKHQHEIDLIRINASKIEAYEIKSAMTYNPSFPKNLDYLRKLLPDRIDRSVVVYDGELENTSNNNGLINFRNFKMLE